MQKHDFIPDPFFPNVCYQCGESKDNHSPDRTPEAERRVNEGLRDLLNERKRERKDNST